MDAVIPLALAAVAVALVWVAPALMARQPRWRRAPRAALVAWQAVTVGGIVAALATGPAAIPLVLGGDHPGRHAAWLALLAGIASGAVIVRLAWQFQSSSRNDTVFPAPQSFVAGPPINVQVSVKDSKRYADSGGWGYGQFENDIPNPDAALTRNCLTCHAKLDALEKDADRVFTAYSH